MGEATRWHGANLSDVQNRPLNYIANIAGHAAVGCGTGAATDGSCQAGALAAGFSGAVGPAIMSATQSIADLNTRLAVGTALSGATGGAGGMLGGGKFENGAMTGAFGYLFNDLAHEARAWGDGGEGFSVSRQLGQYADSLINRVSAYFGWGEEVTVGSGAALQEGIFVTPGQGNGGFFGTIAPAQTCGNFGSGPFIGFQLDDMKGVGWSTTINSPYGGSSVSTDIQGNMNGISYSPPALKLGVSVGPAVTCQVSIKNSGCK